MTAGLDTDSLFTVANNLVSGVIGAGQSKSSKSPVE